MRSLKHIARGAAEQQITLLLRGIARGVFVAVLCSATSLASADRAIHVVTVRIEKRQVVEPEDRRVVVPHNASVAIHWHGDEAGELHVHGYDLRVTLRAGAVTHTRFEAKATGRFPVTSHGFGNETGQAHGHGALLYIEVHPD